MLSKSSNEEEKECRSNSSEKEKRTVFHEYH